MSEQSTEKLVIAFSINDARIAEVKQEIGEVDAYKDFEHAKKAKKTLTKMRSTLADAHKEAKAEALAFGRKCDAEKNRLLEKIAEIEDPITEQLNEIRDAEKRKEEQRLEAIENAIQSIVALSDDRHELDIEQLQDRYTQLNDIPLIEDVFQEHLDRATTTKDDGLMKLRIAINKAEEAKKEAEEQKRLAEENRKEQERLAEERRQFEAEQEQRRKEQEEADRVKREEEKVRLAKQQKKQAEEDERLRKERAELDRKREEQEAREREEREKEEAEERERQRLAQAPDKEKLLAFAKDMQTIFDRKPALDTEPAKEILDTALHNLLTTQSVLVDQAEKL